MGFREQMEVYQFGSAMGEYVEPSVVFLAPETPAKPNQVRLQSVYVEGQLSSSSMDPTKELKEPNSNGRDFGFLGLIDLNKSACEFAGCGDSCLEEAMLPEQVTDNTSCAEGLDFLQYSRQSNSGAPLPLCTDLSVAPPASHADADNIPDGSQPINGLNPTLSTPSQKNVDTSSKNEIDLNKRPQRHISRKKKYWPKVVCECKPKRTSKLKTPKPATPKRASTGKSMLKKKNSVVKRALSFEENHSQDDSDMAMAKDTSHTSTFEEESSITVVASQCSSNHRESVNTEAEKSEQDCCIQCQNDPICVYKRKFQVNQCRTTSRRLGPIFPESCKKRRIGRRRRKNMSSIIWSAILTGPKNYCYSPPANYDIKMQKTSTVFLQQMTIVNDKRFKCEETLCQPEVKTTKKRSNMHTRRQNTADLIALLPIKNLCQSTVETKKKRSKGCTRRRSNFAKLTALPVCNQLPSERQEQKLEISHGPETCNDAFVNSEFHSGKSEGSLAKHDLDGENHARSVAWTEIGPSLLGDDAKWTEMEPSFLNLDFHDNGTDQNPHELSAKSRGKQEESFNFLVERLMCLSDGQNHLLEQDQNSYVPNSGHGTLVSFGEQEQIASGPNSMHSTLVPYQEQDQNAHDLTNRHGILVPYQEQNQNAHDLTNRHGILVPYQEQNQNAHDPTSMHGTLVSYQGPFDPIKKQRALAKVNLDPETMKVWKQLMDNKSSEGETKADEEKEKWWAEERNVFGGRVNAFIAIMNGIQGDRRFTAWKGSVVDSVVGVFLTQNVSDHLSSSAFMSLASKFPSRNHRASCENLQTTDSQESVGSNTESVGATYDSEGNELIVSEPEPDMSYGMENGAETPFSMESSRAFTEPQQSEKTTLLHKSCSNKSSILTFNENPNNEHTEPRGMECGNNLCFDIINDLELNQGAYAFELPLFPTNPECSSQAESGIDEMSQSQKRKMQPANDANTMKKKGRKGRKTNPKERKLSSGMAVDETKTATRGTKIKKVEEEIDWDELRRTYSSAEPRGSNHMDSVDWEAVRCAEHKDVADAIKERGQHNIIAGRIKDFLNRVVTLHKSIDLEWLRNVPPDLAKEYLLKINGLGLKSVECVRLLCLQNMAFPVDTNVGRIAVRLGWVPLQPLPENLQIHLLEQYPLMDTVQKYLWPRLCMLDQRTLYELHYQMITFGKVFCTKRNPNCNACPMKGDCRHFASAFASARLALPAPAEKSIMVHSMPGERLDLVSNPTPLYLLEANPLPGSGSQTKNYEPIIEEPASPEPECTELPDIEDFSQDSYYPDEIPTIKLGIDKFTAYFQNLDENHVMLHDNNVSRALVAVTAEAASIPMPKLKSVSRLRTEHQVYVLPDFHPLLTGLDKREDDDPSPYLLAIWKAGETANSFEPPMKRCNSQSEGLCNEENCFSCISTREQNSNTIRGTILIPCRTATKGSFPLNGTYFQVNEVFADDESSQNPIHVPREWIWHLERRTAYFASSASTMFKGLSTDAIRTGFKEGFICVRGFDRKTGAPRSLVKRLHLLGNKMGKARTDE